MRDFHQPGRSAVLAQNGMCATSHPLAAKTAIDILERGGNAMDAAIAGAVLLGICEPQMTGIGGDCFVLYNRAGENDIRALNGSGRAPAGISTATLRAEGHETVPVNSAHAVTIPAAIDAFCHLAETEGKLGIDALLAPTIHYAEAGVPVAPRVAFDWSSDADALQGCARTAYLIDGRIPMPGEVFRAPGQAEVLRRVAKDGRDAFYTGEIAEDMVASLRALGGAHSLEDFANTRCDAVTPISGTYNDVELVEHPPNGQGATAILMTNILSQFDVASMDPFGTQRAHIEAEAAKLAYDTRNRFLSDPDHMSRLDHMLSMDTARELAALIDPRKAMDARQFFQRLCTRTRFTSQSWIRTAWLCRLSIPFSTVLDLGSHPTNSVSSFRTAVRVSPCRKAIRTRWGQENARCTPLSRPCCDRMGRSQCPSV